MHRFEFFWHWFEHAETEENKFSSAKVRVIHVVLWDYCLNLLIDFDDILVV